MNPLIYGKQTLEKIVSVEIIDDTTEIFIQNELGDVETKHVPNAFWITSNIAKGQGWVRLDGNLHYKYGKKYSKASEFYRAKSVLKKQNVDIFSVSDPKESFLIKEGYTYYKNLQPKDISILSFDIETTGLNHDENSKVLIISNTFRKNNKVIRKLFTYDEFENEGALLTAWCDWVREIDPSTIIAHNGFTFDFPYLQYIAERNNIELLLGRNGSPIMFFNYESQKRIDGSRKQAYHKLRIYGREVIDTMFLAINYDIGKKYESYALKKIIAQENLEVKDRQFYDAALIRDNYTVASEWEKIKQYALHDADDSLALYDLMAPAFFYLAQSVPKSFQGINESASGSQLNSMMIRAYIQDGHSLPKASFVEKFEGAVSYGAPGVYRNCFKVDVASLYPSIMINYKVYDKEKDPKAYMYEMVKTFTAERLMNKKLAKETRIQYYDDMQNAQKIMINSFYGFLGAEGLIFNSPVNAAFVTEKGRDILQTAVQWATGYELKKHWHNEEDWDWVPGEVTKPGKGFVLVNCDTDSITFCYHDGTEITPEERIILLKDLNNLYPERIHFEDDGYYLTIIVLRAKNYVLFDGKKIKTKGSALKDAKKEKALKEFLNEIINAMIEGKDNFLEIYLKYVKEAARIKDMTRWSSKKTISKKVLTNDRTNEVNIRNAIEGLEISEGDKVYMYFKEDGSLSLADHFDGNYDRKRMIEKVFKTAKVFEQVLPKDLFVNYKLKKNHKLLEEML